MDGLGNPLEFIITPGAASDNPLGRRLIEGRKSEYVLADKGYDSNANLEIARKQGTKPVIPPKKNRKNPQECDYELYKCRSQVECYIGKLKYFRRIFSRFDKYASIFLAFIHFAATLQWLK